MVNPRQQEELKHEINLGISTLNLILHGCALGILMRSLNKIRRWEVELGLTIKCNFLEK